MDVFDMEGISLDKIREDVGIVKEASNWGVETGRVGRANRHRRNRSVDGSSEHVKRESTLTESSDECDQAGCQTKLHG